MTKFDSRTEDLVVEQLDGGVMVYDTRSHVAHWLDLSAAAVWRACTGGADEASIARVAQLEPAACELALSRLVAIDLVHCDAAGYSRRTVLRTAAKVGVAGVAAAPIISAVIPVAAAHASTGPTGGPGGGGGKQVTYTIQSGTNDGKGPNDGYQDSAVDGTPDLTNETSDDRTTWTTAINVMGAYGWAWNIIPDSGWIDASSEPPNYVPYYFRPSGGLTIPPGATNASISGEFLSDNEGWAMLGSTVIGDGSSNQFSTPTSFSANLSPGTNDFYFKVVNEGGPGGLDYVATITYTL